MTARRELQLAIALCLLGSVLILIGVAQHWVTLTISGSLTIDDFHRAVSGAVIAPGLRALGFLGLAGVVAIAATRGAGRTVVGALITGAGVLALVVTVRWADSARLLHEASDRLSRCTGPGLCFIPQGPWPGTSVSYVGLVLAGLGGIVLAAAGLLVVVRGRRWAGLSASYEAPGAAPEPPVTDKGTWDALDRGDDPTA